MDQALSQAVRERARQTCEYCQMPQAFYRARFQIDHIIAKQHGGATFSDNLALSCLHCNRYKGPNIAGLDPDTGDLVRLFHPRQDNWHEHFGWEGAILTGRTPVGRSTVNVLSINHPQYVSVRSALIDEGVFPPVD